MSYARALVAAVVWFGLAGGWQAAAQEPEEAAEDYSFDVEEFEKKPYEWGGFLELKGTQLVLDRDARLFSPGDPVDGSRPLVHQASGLLDLNAKLRKDLVTAYGHVRGEAGAGQQGFSRDLRVFRLSLAVQPIPLLNLEVGKTMVRWGKGYAFNPIAFVDRPKDPGDPEEALEGFVLARAGLTKSFDGPLKTISLEVALLPVHEGVNEDFGRPGYENFAARLSLLLFDADIDLVALSGGSRTVRYGLGLAYNITSNLEVHAEAALMPDAPVPRLASGEPPHIQEQVAVQALGGARFLTPQETTFIVEYYYNGTGASPGQLGLFYEELNAADPAAVIGHFRVPFPMRHYLYARVTQKEPFGMLDFFPSVFGIVSLEDGSFTLTPELLYKGITNLELRLRGTVLVGRAETDFGERPNDARIELRARYFF